MSYTLLSLPGELRNQVYELVLSEAKGLQYVQNSLESGNLCLHDSLTEVVISEGEKIVETDNETAISSSKQTSEHTSNHSRIIGNQLQFVCRQLRSETKHLEVLYNSIMFTSPESATFLLFMDSLPPHFRDHQHVFLLKAPISQWERMMFGGLTKFCRTYPRCTLKFYHPKLLSSTPTSIIFTAILVKHGARKDTSFIGKVTKETSLQQKILDVLPGQVENQLVDLIPPNLTFYPYDNFDEIVFRKACGESNIIRDVLAPTLGGGIDDLVAIGKDCYMSGF